MANTKTNPGAGTDLTIKTRYFSDAACKQIAARISAEMRKYPAHLALFHAFRLPNHNLAVIVPMWGPDYDAVEAKINRLYHPEEAALIIEALTP